MTKQSKSVFVVLLGICLSQISSADLPAAGTRPGPGPNNWYNRPQVFQAASRLLMEVGHTDEALHSVNAPTDLILKMHHFEETVEEFVQGVNTNFTYQDALAEFNHIRLDVQSIRQSFYQYQYLLQYPQVNTEYQHMYTAYRYLDHQMYMFRSLGLRGTAELEEAVRQMDEAHAN